MILKPAMTRLMPVALVVPLMLGGCVTEQPRGVESTQTSGIGSSSSTASGPVVDESTTVASVDSLGTTTTETENGPVVPYLAAIYPVMTQPELDDLLESDLPLDSERDLVDRYLFEMTRERLTSMELLDEADGERYWRALTPTLSVVVSTSALGVREDGSEVFFVMAASNMPEDWTLSALVQPENGEWRASFIFPPGADRALVSYSSGPWQVEGETTTGEISFELPSEPVQQARLAIVEFDQDDNVVAFHHILIRAGAFAAG